jgi:hypothetical protein
MWSARVAGSAVRVGAKAQASGLLCGITRRMYTRSDSSWHPLPPLRAVWKPRCRLSCFCRLRCGVVRQMLQPQCRAGVGWRVHDDGDTMFRLSNLTVIPLSAARVCALAAMPAAQRAVGPGAYSLCCCPVLRGWRDIRRLPARSAARRRPSTRALTPTQRPQWPRQAPRRRWRAAPRGGGSTRRFAASTRC